MQANTRNFFLLAVAAAVGITVSLLLLMSVRHMPPPPQVVKTAAVAGADLRVTAKMSHALEASGSSVDDLRVTVVEGVAIIRGTVASSEQIDAVAATARNLGYTRVTNLVEQRAEASATSPY